MSSGWVAAIALFAGALCCAQQKRSITVNDAIAMTRLADPDYFHGLPSDGRVAHFSPDGRLAAVVLRRGDLKTDTNIYSIYLFRTSELFHSSKVRPLIQMRSASNRAAIGEVKWLADNRTIAFLGTSHGCVSQVFTLDTHDGRIKQRTKHRTAIEHYDISSDGRVIAFLALPLASGTRLLPEQRNQGILIQNQPLPDIFAGRFNVDRNTDRLYLQTDAEREVYLPATHLLNTNSSISMKPDGRYALVTAYVRTPPRQWAAYSDDILHLSATRPLVMGNDRAVAQFFLLDCRRGTARALLDAPAIYSAQYRWDQSGTALDLKTYLPLGGQSSAEQEARKKTELPVRVDLSTGSIVRLTSSEWESTLPLPAKRRPRIALDEGINDPPRLVAYSGQGDRCAELLDLNPQFAELRFGKVELLPFLVHGIRMQAAVYLPPDYQADKRYPVVIQTHGFDPDRFSMDGADEWSSGFAARPLAAAGIIVVQAQRFVEQDGYGRVAADRTLGTTIEQGFRNFMCMVYQQIVIELNRRKMIDVNGVGISGFSRTVWFVSYAITHPTTRYRAVLLTDGIDGSYFEYIADRQAEFELDNGGSAPLTDKGLRQWLNEAPGFNLDKIDMPVRLVSFGHPLSLWETFVGLQLRNKPVELLDMPNADHLLQRPSDRFVAMQGMVDWFRFWLQGFRDPSPSKAPQYRRWERMCNSIGGNGSR